jgi:hypothetical protein
MRGIVTAVADRVLSTLASHPRLPETAGGVLIFILLGYYPWVLLLTWAICFYLTFIESRQQHLDGLHTLWWMLLVFFTHFIGYLALRGWVFYKRQHAT